MSKVIFLDVDGTLVDYQGSIPNTAKAAIKAARNNGHTIIICTGRSKAEIYDEIWDIGLDGMIGGNGSYVECQGETLLEITLSETECKDVVDWLHGNQLEFYLECNSGLYASEHFVEKGKPFIQKYARGKGMEDVSHLDVPTAFPDMIYHAPLLRKDVNKISYLLEDYQYYRDAQKRFPNLKHGTWGGKDELALFGDIGINDISKASAIDIIIKKLGLTKEDSIAFGDANIDIPMFEYCGYSICMGNGSKEAKSACDYITRDVDQDGLLYAFEYLKLV